MKAVSVGDVFYVESPFISTVGPKHEKHLSYLLGTISSRPVIVIREPMHWDSYNMVNVIPSLSGGHPAISLKLLDRYDRETPADYNFMPHISQNIPVGRLGRRIGTLEPHELEELLYAHTWINNPYFQKENPVPECYKDVFSAPKPASWRYSKDHRDSVKFNVDNNMRLNSLTNPELNGMELTLDIKRIVNPTVSDMFTSDPDYQPEEVAVKDGTDDERRMFIPVEKGFPKSLFNDYDLHRVAGRFSIDAGYYTNKIGTRDPEVLTIDEISNICNGRSLLNFQQIKDLYRNMYPVDAFLFGPRLPSKTLSELLHITYDDAIILKLMCNTMGNMDEKVYQARIASKSKCEISEELVPTAPKTATDVCIAPYGEISTMTDSAGELYTSTDRINWKRAQLLQDPAEAVPMDGTIINSPTGSLIWLKRDGTMYIQCNDADWLKCPTFEDRYPQITDSKEQDKALNKIKSFLTHKHILNIHRGNMEWFVRLPKYVIKRAYTGKAFELYYKDAITKYTEILEKGVDTCY